MNDNNYYITTSFISCNSNSYYNVITIILYQLTCPKCGTCKFSYKRTQWLHDLFTSINWYIWDQKQERCMVIFVHYVQMGDVKKIGLDQRTH